MFKIIAPVLAVSLWLFAGSASAEILINGAGATSPYPLYATWFSEYLKIDKDVKFNYQTIDSIGAVKEIIARTVDFGATDIFLSDEELKAAPGTVIHIPTIMMAEVVTYNLPGIGSGIKFPTELLADIYLGKITKWNDPKIAVCNPDIKLPDKAIIAVYRSDRSGTAIIFSDYLASVSEEWAAKVGKGGSIKWPVGLGAKGNEGVVAQVRSNPYAIGYVQWPYAFNNKLPYAHLKNREGRYVEPTSRSISAAADEVVTRRQTDFRISLVNQPGKDTYPLVSLAWVLVYEQQKDKVKGKKLVDFLSWCLNNGQELAAPLRYAPLPESVQKIAETSLNKIK